MLPRANSSFSRGLSLDVRYEGDLRLKTASLRGSQWRDVHVTLTEASSLIFFRKDSTIHRKPLLSLTLNEVHRIERISSSTQFFAFALVPYISSTGVVKLAANSEESLSMWLKMLRKVRTLSDPRLPPSHDDTYDCNSIIPTKLDKCHRESPLPKLRSHNNDDVIYEAIEEANKTPLSHFVDDLITFDDSHSISDEVINEEDASMDLFINSAPASESLLKRDFFNDLLQLEDLFSVNTNDNSSHNNNQCKINSESYYNAAFLYGSKSESINLLRLKALNGVYLVRVDSVLNKHYLEVLDDFMVLTFEVLYELRGCRLSTDVLYFYNITFLLYHYSFNKLPNSCTHLEIPFRLIETI